MRPNDLLHTASVVWQNIAAREFVGLANLTGGRRYSAGEIAVRLAELEVVATSAPPDWASAMLELLAMGDAWRLRLPLWSGGRRTDVVVTCLVEPDRHIVLAGIDRIPDYEPDPEAVPQAEILAVVAAHEQYIEQSRQADRERSAALAAADPPELPTDVADAIRHTLELLTTGRYDELAESAPAGIFTAPADAVREIMDNYGDGWTMPPHGIPPDTEIMVRNPDHVEVEGSLWNVDGETDLMIFLDLRREPGESTYRVALAAIRVA